MLMGNHAHYVMKNYDGRTHALVSDLDSFKRYTARRANSLLARKGRFWARDHFDHWIRHPVHFESFVRYTVLNPCRAGLVHKWEDWPWTEIDDEVKYCVDDSIKPM